MNNHFKDITDKLGNPKWYDSLGYPRYYKFTPQREHNIYAKYVALVLIACQRCGKKMKVSISLSRTDILLDDYRRNTSAIIQEAKSAKTKKQKSEILGKLIENKKEEPFSKILKRFLPNKKTENHFTYGDPPHHNDYRGEFCHAGGTMMSETVKILEFWEKDKDHNWVRNKKYEITYPYSF